MRNNQNKIGFGKLCRGLALIILGVLVLRMPTGCGSAIRKNQSIPDEGEKIVYSDTQFRMVQEKAIHAPASIKEREYVLIPLTIQNDSNKAIIFSTRICVKAYALPSGESIPYSHDAIMYGKEHIQDFRLFDGIIFSGKETDGWLAFDVPEGSQSLHIDLSIGMESNECLSFDCKI